MKYLIVIITGICIDTFQILVWIAMTGVFVAVGLLPIVGGAVGMGSELVGQVIDICISLTFGGGFIFLLVFLDLLPARQLLSMNRMPFMLVKFIPFLDIVPSYTALAVVSVLKKLKEEKLAAASNPAPDEDPTQNIQPTFQEAANDNIQAQPQLAV